MTYTLLLRGFRVCTLMVSGLEIRMNRIMNQGRMLCIPMDHGISNGPIPGLEDPHGAIAKCANHGLTSVIINKGVLKSMPKPTRIGILVHFSSSTSLSSQPNRSKCLQEHYEEAVRLGADGTFHFTLTLEAAMIVGIYASFGNDVSNHFSLSDFHI